MLKLRRIEDSRGDKMKDSYIFEYVNENEFIKYERSLKKYNMLAYKKLYFSFYPSFKEGKFLGEIISTDEANKTKNYELKLPTDVMFSKVHGDIKLHYTVYEDKKIVYRNTRCEDLYARDTFGQERRQERKILVPAAQEVSCNLCGANVEKVSCGCKTCGQAVLKRRYVIM